MQRFTAVLGGTCLGSRPPGGDFRGKHFFIACRDGALRMHDLATGALQKHVVFAREALRLQYYTADCLDRAGFEAAGDRSRWRGGLLPGTPRQTPQGVQIRPAQEGKTCLCAAQALQHRRQQKSREGPFSPPPFPEGHPLVGSGVIPGPRAL